ncbi:MAG: hypothetical protein K9G58_07900 [Bacteroidales bacterium]|nr:hypothetical protein [Bacteroidales bacterium]MCF8388640.1 hypothetical protein [Bacteroidales bacterium]MCF8398073.1 hypothetical protein [Bacteroidales bacterium]
MNNFINILMLATTLIILSGCSQDAYQLSYRLESGETYYIDAAISQSLQQDFMQQDMKMSTNINATAEYEVAGKQDGIYDLQVSYSEFDMALNTPQGQMEFGTSKQDTTDDFSNILKSMSDNKFELKMTERGSIQSVRGIEKMFDEMLSSMENTDQTSFDQLKKSLDNIAGTQSFKGNFGMGMPFYPEDNVKVGDTWTNEVELKTIALGKVSNTWKLMEVKKNIIRISGEGYFVSYSDSASIAGTGIPMQFDMEGPINYLLNIDLKTGWIKSGTIDQDIQGMIKMQASEQMPQGLEMNMNITTSMEVKGGKKR